MIETKHLRQKAINWMADHPHVLKMFTGYSDEMIERGRKHAINLLKERVRWECLYEYGDEEFKFCNSFAPYVARWMLHREPRLAEYMRFRLTKDEKPHQQVILITQGDIDLAKALRKVD